MWREVNLRNRHGRRRHRRLHTVVILREKHTCQQPGQRAEGRHDELLPAIRDELRDRALRNRQTRRARRQTQAEIEPSFGPPIPALTVGLTTIAAAAATAAHADADSGYMRGECLAKYAMHGQGLLLLLLLLLLLFSLRIVMVRLDYSCAMRGRICCC